MERRELTFRVFVSSTFSDLVAERNALQEHVFPRLRGYCQEHGARFQAIDLRWGVSEEAALDQQTMNICLEELRRCQRTSPRPNFIVLLGQRYGWCPLPPQIIATEFEAIRDQITASDDRALLEHWYRRDDNAVPPEYCLQPRAVDVGEKQSEPEQEAAREGEARAWGETEHRLRAILLVGMNRLAWPVTDERRLKYEASATHQEMLHGALQVKDTIDHVFGFLRTIDGLPQDARASGYLDLDSQGRPDAEAHERLDRLQADMRTRLPNNIFTYSATWNGTGPSTDHLQHLCADVYDRLRNVIDEELQRRDRSDPLDQEAIAHQTFGQERARVLIGRQDLLQLIQHYLDGQDRQPLVVHGVSGSGKSALMAKAAEQQASEARSQKSEVVERYIGATPASSDIRSLLEGLCKEITLRYGGDASTVPVEFTKLEVEFPNRLALATAEKPLVVFLDALDQLNPDDGAHQLSWLPRQPPPHVKLVVSVLEGAKWRDPDRKPQSGGPAEEVEKPVRDSLSLLRGSLPAENFVRLEPLTAAYGEQLLEVWLAEARRTSQPPQRRELMQKFTANGLPLYLKLAFEEARRWKSWLPSVTLSSDIPGILKDFFARLQQPYHHGAFLAGRTLEYLAAARHGLTEDELLEILSADGDVMADFIRHSPTERSKPQTAQLKALPVLLWSRLRADLGPCLMERLADDAIVLAFFHREVGQVVRDGYLAEEIQQAHRHLADYFERQPNSLRRVEELPWQLAEAGRWRRLFEFLADLRNVAFLVLYRKTDVKRYWRGVELFTPFRMPELYREIIENPKLHERVALAISDLLDETGYPDQAMTLLTNLCQHYTKQGDDDGVFVCLSRLGLLHRLKGNLEKALMTFKECEVVAQRAGLLEKVTSVIHNQATVLRELGQLDEAMTLARRAEQDYRHNGNERSLCDCLNLQSAILSTQGHVQESMALLDQARDIALSRNFEEEIAHLTIVKAGLLFQGGHLTNAQEFVNYIEPFFAQVGDVRHLAVAHRIAGLILKARGEYEAALSQHKLSADLFKRLGYASGLGEALGNQAEALLRLHRPEEALHPNEESIAIFRRIGNRAGLAVSCVNQGIILHGLGKMDEAENAWREAEHLSRELNFHQNLGHALSGLAHLHLENRRLREAKESFDAAIDAFTKSGASEGLCGALLGRARLLFAELDERMSALSDLERVLDLSQRSGYGPFLLEALSFVATRYRRKDELPFALASAEELLATTATQGGEAYAHARLAKSDILMHLGRLDEAEKEAAAAVEFLRKSDLKSTLALALMQHAFCLRSLDSVDEATKFLDEGILICRDIRDWRILVQLLILKFQVLKYDLQQQPQADKCLTEVEELARQHNVRDSLERIQQLQNH